MSSSVRRRGVDSRGPAISLAALSVALLASIAMPLSAQMMGQTTTTSTTTVDPNMVYACYVPLTGTVYRIKAAGTPSECYRRRAGTANHERDHVEFSWAKAGAATPGPMGPAGPAGPQGVAGPTGATGPAGPQGEIGPMGPAGPQGVVGPMGPAGPQGVAGPIGPAGAIGPVGPQGDAGPQGIAGPTGPTGATGPVGPQGATGPIGPQGVKGDVGATGATGPQGVQGVQGIQGIPGVSGYQIMTAPLTLDGMESDWNFALCPLGKRPVGGGFYGNGGNSPSALMDGSGPWSSGNNYGWAVRIKGTTSSQTNYTIYAICVTALP